MAKRGDMRCKKGEIFFNGKCVKRKLPEFFDKLGTTFDIFVDVLEEELTAEEIEQIKHELNDEFVAEIRFLKQCEAMFTSEYLEKQKNKE